MTTKTITREKEQNIHDIYKDFGKKVELNIKSIEERAIDAHINEIKYKIVCWIEKQILAILAMIDNITEIYNCIVIKIRKMHIIMHKYGTNIRGKETNNSGFERQTEDATINIELNEL